MNNKTPKEQIERVLNGRKAKQKAGFVLVNTWVKKENRKKLLDFAKKMRE